MDLQNHYEEIMTAYNREKDRATIEETFVALLELIKELDAEESRAVREGLDEESALQASEVKRVKVEAGEGRDPGCGEGPDQGVVQKADVVYTHVLHTYPTVLSPYYESVVGVRGAPVCAP